MEFKCLCRTSSFLNKDCDKKINAIVDDVDKDIVTKVLESIRSYGNIPAYKYKGSWVIKINLTKKYDIELDKYYTFTLRTRRYSFVNNGVKTQGHTFTAININKEF